MSREHPENKSDKVFISVTVMAEILKHRYPDINITPNSVQSHVGETVVDGVKRGNSVTNADWDQMQILYEMLNNLKKQFNKKV